MNLKQFALLFLIASVAWDLATTTVGLALPGIFEANSRVQWLINNGLQLPVEVTVGIGFVLFTLGMEKIVNYYGAHPLVSYAGILVYSSLRAICGFWNLALIIDVVRGL